MVAGMGYLAATGSMDGIIQICMGRIPVGLIKCIFHLMRVCQLRLRFLPTAFGWMAGQRQTMRRQAPTTAATIPAWQDSALLVMMVRSMSSSMTGMWKELPWLTCGLCTGTRNGRRLPGFRNRKPNRIDGGKLFRQIHAREENYHYTSGCLVGNGLCLCADWLR